MQIPVSLIAASIDGALLQGKRNILIKRLIADSRQIKPGDLFVCVQGQHVDGHRFIEDAIKRGASGLLLARPINHGLYTNIAIIKVNDVSKALKQLVPRFYNYPSEQLTLIGVTGTNGKTSVTQMIKSIWSTKAKGSRKISRIGVMGTIQHEIADQVVPALNTTPMAWDVQRLLGEMVDAKCQLAIMEVSSHALVENRVADCDFDIAIYTNLTREHLDYHGTMDHYAAAKRRLFTQLVEVKNSKKNKTAIINMDDAYGQRMAKAAAGVNLLTYGIDTISDIMAKNISVSHKSSVFRLEWPKNSIIINLKLIGRHNIYNALAAATAGIALGLSANEIKKGLESIKVIPGRLEPVSSSQRFMVLVDYAHTPDALKQVLIATKELTKKRLILVFGCGGNRDTSKRAPMGAIATKFADYIFITSDNPRQEDPESIIKEILDGIPKEARTELEKQAALVIEVDRQKAIEAAIKIAKPGDLVLIAGKGHENYQILKDKTIALDDRKIAKRVLAKRRKS